ncbi:DMT family transporter [Ectobacillus ponti]|uniref:DMT family transporter n=1 Tax=Ectobacillus ponti TaxID=2961894 RepID=A0AA42BRE8_9BACI|nr:DMT family transporter [Ectobacillus ponti]MCP8969414.1 DMT family transporter [Ectobacillus ponti]
MKKYHMYVLLFCVMVAWGFNVIATKLLVAAFLPVTMTAFRIFTAGCSVFIVLFLMKKVRRLTRREFLYVAFGALLNVVGHHYFLSVGLSKTTASNGGLILGLGPLLTSIMAVIFLGSAMSVLRVIGIVLGLSGVSFIVLEGGGIAGVSFGDVDVFLAILLQAASFILIKKASETLDPRLMTGYMLLIGSGFLFVLGLWMEPDGLAQMKHGSPGIWAVFFASAVLATAFGHMSYNYAIQAVGAAEASIFLNLTPFFSLLGAVVFLGEKLVFAQVAGFVMILGGVLLGSGSAEELYLNRKRKMRAAG